MFKILVLIAVSSLSYAHVFKEYMKLNDGNKIPIVGLGTYNLGDEAQKTKSILDAIDVGFRFFDTAFEYDNEKAIGKALTQALNSGKVKREDLFITTKIWGTYHRRPKVIEGLKISLHDLNITYADLVLVHWPTGFQEGNNTFPKSANGSLIPRTMEKDAYLDCWKGLEDAHKLGLAKSIGVANFNKRQLQRVLDTAVIKPAINQFESNPYFNAEKLVKFCESHNVSVIAYSPLRRGDKALLSDPVLKEIADKHNKTIPQVALRWNIQRGLIVIPKATQKAHQAEDLKVFDFSLSEDEMKRIFGLKQREKIIVIPNIESHPDFPFHPSDE